MKVEIYPMEWNRGTRPTQPNGVPVNHPAPGHVSSSNKGGKLSMFKSLRFLTVVLLFAVTIVLVAFFAYVLMGGPEKQSDSVDNSKMQAVFLNGGQVYFGHIGELNSQYMKVSDIYYLRVNQQVQPNQSTTSSNDISLVKLGCELHGPEDSMVINQDQVIFWENLKADGQVAKAVDEYKKQNPNGQTCDTAAAADTTTPAATPAATTPKKN